MAIFKYYGRSVLYQPSNDLMKLVKKKIIESAKRAYMNGKGMLNIPNSFKKLMHGFQPFK